MGGTPGRDAGALARHDAILRGAIERTAVTWSRRPATGSTRRSHRIRRGRRRRSRRSWRSRLRTGRCHGTAPRSYGHPHRRGRVARRRLLRHGGQPRRPDHVGRARRPDRGVADHQGARPRTRRRSSSSTWASTASATSARPERIFQVVHPDLRQDFPALRSVETSPPTCRSRPRRSSGVRMTSPT